MPSLLDEFKTKTFLALLAVLAILMIMGLFNANNEVVKNGVVVGNAAVDVELALDFGSQRQGLSGRASLRPNQGMLFVYHQPTHLSFWMKDMNFPLDILWIDDNLKVVHITADARPESYPASFSPPVPVRYVLEVVGGFASRHNITAGAQVKFTPGLREKLGLIE